MNKFKVGDTVRVVNDSRQHPGYSDMATRLVNKSNGKAYMWTPGWGFGINLNNYTGEIVGIGTDESSIEFALVNFQLSDCNRSALFTLDGLELCEIEFTFQEVVARNVPGVYVNCSDDGERIKSIEIWNNGDFKINGDFRGLDVLGCPLGIDKSLKFKLQEPKKQCVLYGIEHKEGGKIYYFRNEGNFRNKGAKVIPDGSFVVCDTRQGKSYGRAVQRIKKELTEEEYLNYKECWRA